MRTQILNLALFMIFVSYLYPDQSSVQPVLQPDEAMFKGDQEGDLEGNFKQDMEVDLLSNSGQVRSGSGLVPFSAQIYSIEFDSEVGRLVFITGAKEVTRVS